MMTLSPAFVRVTLPVLPSTRILPVFPDSGAFTVTLWSPALKLSFFPGASPSSESASIPSFALEGSRLKKPDPLPGFSNVRYPLLPLGLHWMLFPSGITKDISPPPTSTGLPSSPVIKLPSSPVSYTKGVVIIVIGPSAFSGHLYSLPSLSLIVWPGCKRISPSSITGIPSAPIVNTQS